MPAIAKTGFSISYDGQHVAGEKSLEEQARAVDVALSETDIQVKFDGLDVKPMLNVATVDLGRAYGPDEPITFVTSSNYPDWIASAEIRIFRSLDGAESARLISRVAAPANGTVQWRERREAGRYTYVLRVTDHQGRYDETVPMSLVVTHADQLPHEVTGASVAAGLGEDRTGLRNIPVYGGAVTVYGHRVPPGTKATVMGADVPIDREGSFVTQRILPPGDHDVELALANGDKTASFVRKVNIPTHEFFYVALADLTVGKRFGSAKVVAAEPGEYNNIYSKGRLAFYLKGKIQGRYLLTASADTGEDNLKNLLKGMDGKDPRHLLRRIDPDDYYPVYGDDSTTVEDAPTSGKFYVRLERGESHVLWGNFQSHMRGNNLVTQERKLYGAQATYRSEAVTGRGEKRVEASIHAAKPETLPQRDVFRGTGGSAYFLKRQDITSGSETITVIESDPVTGRILSRKQLAAGQDYSIDYLQGIVILQAPLPSTTRDGSSVRDGALGANILSLAVSYEYTPSVTDVKGYSLGGRAQAWLSDYLRVGGVVLSEDNGAADQKMAGFDVRFRASDTSFIDLDYGESKGPGFGRTLSTDGGLTLLDELTTGLPRRSRAASLRAQLDLQDLSSTLQGIIGGHYDYRQRGFSSLDSSIAATQTDWGVFADLQLTDRIGLKLQHDSFKSKSGNDKTTSSGEVVWEADPDWTFVIGLKHSDINTTTADDRQSGRRLDAGARIEWHPEEAYSAYVFGQTTARKSSGMRNNDRAGAGFAVQVSEKTDLEAEASYGTTGFAGLAALNYHPTPDDKYYLGYRLDADRDEAASITGRDLGGVVLGARHKYNDWLAAYGENTYDMFGQRRSLTSTYGVTYTPDAAWTISGGVEVGDIVDPNAADFYRVAPSLSVAFRQDEQRNARLRMEARFEDSDDGTRDRETYLISAGYSDRFDEQWRLLLNADAVISNSDQSSFLDGDYVEASAGLAYRPIEDDRWNALFKYTYLYDLPGPDQIAYSTSSILGPAQHSHVFSADATYEFNEYLTLGAKYGFRIGEVSPTRRLRDFEFSSAHLGVIRADISVTKEWDALLEGRALVLSELDSVDLGALAAVYRHVGDNFKVGIGYNFGHFSDDLTDLTYDDHGIFFNAVGKF